MPRYSLILVALVLSACDSTPEGQSSDGGTTVAPAPAASQVYSIGQTAIGNRFELTLTSVEERAKASDNMAEEAGSGQIFVVAKYTIKNLTAEPIAISDLPSIDLLDANGTAYAADDFNSLMASDEDPMDAVNPGVTFRSVTAWKVAEGALNRSKWKVVVRANPAPEFRLK